MHWVKRNEFLTTLRIKGRKKGEGDKKTGLADSGFDGARLAAVISAAVQAHRQQAS